jgi:hypothetical protein
MEKQREEEERERDGERREERGKGGQCTIRPNRFLPVYQEKKTWNIINFKSGWFSGRKGVKLAKSCKIG